MQGLSSEPPRRQAVSSLASSQIEGRATHRALLGELGPRVKSKQQRTGCYTAVRSRKNDWLARRSNLKVPRGAPEPSRMFPPTGKGGKRGQSGSSEHFSSLEDLLLAISPRPGLRGRRLGHW